MNTEMNEQTDGLLVKYMLGEASAAEQEEVQQWLLQSELNRTYYQQLETIWQQSKQLEAKSNINEEEAWQRFKQRTVAGRTSTINVIPLPAPRKTLHRLLAAAAVVVLAAGSWIVYQSAGLGNQMTLTAGNTVITDTLPDGSIVTLNKNASLDYSKSLATTGSSRQVTLKGEAFFDIAADRNRPFIIKAGDVTVKVTGTSFNVKRSSNNTEIIVETGSVEVTHHQESIQLKQKEKVTITQSNNRLMKQSNQSELYTYYRTRQFVCRSTPLYQLVASLNEAYDANIVIANSAIKDMPLTTTFSQQPLDSILPIIEKTLNIHVVREKEQIILK